MTARDGRDDANGFEDIDWLMSQLGSGRRPDLEGHDAPPPDAEPDEEAEPPTAALPETGPTGAEPPAPPAAEESSGPRRSEETLDWFSVAEPASREPDAATRELPVVGEPTAPREEPTGPREEPTAPVVPPAGPAWSSPFGVRPPVVPQQPESPPVEAAPPSRLTSVEPPVGASTGPVPPIAEPPAPPTPPGPVTPTASFALTWGDAQGPDAAEPPTEETTPPPVTPASFTPVQPGAPVPPSWDEVEAAARRPEQPAQPDPAAQPDDYAEELWSALHEAEPAEPTAPAPPAAPAPASEARGRFDSFAADAFDAPTPAAPFDRAPAQPPQPVTPPLQPAAPPFTPPGVEPPHQTFQPAPFGERTPVDDLLAALGGSAALGHSDRGAFGQSDAAYDNGRGQRPVTGPIPFSELGRALGGGVGGPASPDAPEESAIAREIAETGYFWNLTPDPSGVDPKTAADAAVAADEGAYAAGAEPSDERGDARADADQRDLFGAPPEGDPEPDAWVDDVPPAAQRHEPDDQDAALAALFGAAGGADPVQAGFSGSQADPWATEGFDALGRGPAPVGAAAGAGAAFGAAAAPAPSAGVPAAPATPGPGRGPGGPTAPGASTSSTSGGGRKSPVKILAWIAGGLVAVLVLVGLFFLGTQLTGGSQTAASESPSPTEATPTAVPEPTAPQPAGVHAWNTLFGGECLDPFETPWAEEFTVVDCAAPHAAQLVYRGKFPDDAAAPFPGEQALAEQMPALCSAPGIFDLAAAGGLTDLQVQGSFPVTEEQWAAGERTYYCFANRSSGEPLTGSVQGPGPAV